MINSKHRRISSSWLMGAILAMMAWVSLPSFAAETLIVGVPSAVAAQGPAHPYRPGFEREVMIKACAYMKNVRCLAKELPTYPGPTTEADLKAAGLDASLNGPVPNFGPKADKVGFLEAVNELAEIGELGRLTRHYLDKKRAWGKTLSVGVDAANEAVAKKVCADIRAECVITKVANAKELNKQFFDLGKFDWVAGSMGWMFRDKGLEIRIGVAQDPAGTNHDH